MNRRCAHLQLLLCAACAACAALLIVPVPARAGEDRVDDAFTIQCITFSGVERNARAKVCVESLKKVRNLRNNLIQTVDRGNETAVCYGRYVRTYDVKSGKESFKPDPQPDLVLLRELSLPVKNKLTGREDPAWPFRLASIVPLPGPPSKNPEWELPNAKGYWSLQVGVFYNTPDMQQRRFAAEEYCRELRKKGHEAYFHHGAINSCVFVGAFPQEAIQNYTKKQPLTGITETSSRMVDPKLLALQREFPYNHHNGYIFYDISQDPKTGEKKRDPHASFPVIIPRPENENAPAQPKKRP